jgi:hypothetical protein
MSELPRSPVDPQDLSTVPAQAGAPTHKPDRFDMVTGRFFNNSARKKFPPDWSRKACRHSQAFSG